MTFFIVVGIINRIFLGHIVSFYVVLIYLIHAKAVILSLRLRTHLTANVLWTTWSASQKSWQWIFVRIFVTWNLTVSANLDKLMIGHGGYKCESNNVTHEGHEHDLEEEESYFLLCSWVECNFISKYSVSVKKEKKYYLHDHKHWNDCFNSNITDIIYIIGISLALSLLLTPRFLIHFYWLF